MVPPPFFPPLVRRVEFLLLSGKRRGEFALCCIAHTGPTLLSSLYNSREKKRVSLTSVRFPSLSPLTPSYGLPPSPSDLKSDCCTFFPSLAAAAAVSEKGTEVSLPPPPPTPVCNVPSAGPTPSDATAAHESKEAGHASDAAPPTPFLLLSYSVQATPRQALPINSLHFLFLSAGAHGCLLYGAHVVVGGIIWLAFLSLSLSRNVIKCHTNSERSLPAVFSALARSAIWRGDLSLSLSLLTGWGARAPRCEEERMGGRKKEQRWKEFHLLSLSASSPPLPRKKGRNRWKSKKGFVFPAFSFLFLFAEVVPTRRKQGESGVGLIFQYISISRITSGKEGTSVRTEERSPDSRSEGPSLFFA